jgi:hypothetical protein
VAAVVVILIERTEIIMLTDDTKAIMMRLRPVSFVIEAAVS